jgi:hypothetical protein
MMRVAPSSSVARRWRSGWAGIALLTFVGCAVYDQGAANEEPTGGGGSSTAGGGSESRTDAGASGKPTSGGSTGGQVIVGSAGGSVGGTASGSGSGGSSGGSGSGGTDPEPTAGTAPEGGGAGEPAMPILLELATGHPATSSTHQADKPASMGNDGSHDTRWSSDGAALPQWWKVDLGASHVLESILVRWEFGNVEYTYAIEVSENGTDFIPAVIVDPATGPPHLSDFPVGTKARYVRLNITKIVPENWSSIYEVTVMGY